jgi:hypothetical protein
MPNVPIQVRLSVAEVSALDSYRRAKSNPPSRARALHELACGALHELQPANASDDREGGHPLEVSAMARSNASAGAD